MDIVIDLKINLNAAYVTKDAERIRKLEVLDITKELQKSWHITKGGSSKRVSKSSSNRSPVLPASTRSHIVS